MQIDLYSINHKKDDRQLAPVVGGIAREFIVGEEDDGELSKPYCDMAAPYYVWKHVPLPPIIGFHGYRKQINFRDGMVAEAHQIAPGWDTVTLEAFMGYQEWLAEWDGKPLEKWLSEADMLTVEPFDCSYNCNIGEDYARSRSAYDWLAFEKVMRRHGDFNFDTPYIRPMHFVCRNTTFTRWMRFFDRVRRELEPLVLSEDARTPDYPARNMAFLSERMWSLWLDQSRLRVKTFPLWICWSAK